MSTASYKIPIYDSFTTWSWVLADSACRLRSESWCLRVAAICLTSGILSETQLAGFRTLVKCWSRSALHLLWYLGMSSFVFFSSLILSRDSSRGSFRSVWLEVRPAGKNKQTNEIFCPSFTRKISLIIHQEVHKIDERGYACSVQGWSPNTG